MTQPPAVLDLPSAPQQEKDVHGETAGLLTQSLMDLDLAERVERALRATGYTALRSVEIAAHDGRVVLRGRVPSYHMKQIAQAAVLAVPGAVAVRNDLDVAGTH
jgi:osmotically-inducible protein OsmY